MTITFTVGSYDVGFATNVEEIAACQSLRHECFFQTKGLDADPFDPLCRHLMIKHADRLIATCRLMVITSGTSVDMCYAAQRYDLTALHRYQGRMLEIGRLCIAPDQSPYQILRLCWGALAEVIHRSDIQLIFGCTSFAGTDPNLYQAGMAYLADRHLATGEFSVGLRQAESVRLASNIAYDKGEALAQLPPLLRSYLNLGAWVSDHAVIDREMNTIHVFTGLEVSSVPKPKARALRSIAAQIANPLAESVRVA